MFSFMNTNSGSIIAILTFVLAAISGIYAFLTWKMVKETKRMREIQSEPQISIFYKSKDEYINLIDLVIKNIGPGPAYKLAFKASPDFEYSEGMKLSEMNIFKNGLKYLAPNQELVFFLNSLIEISSKKLCSYFDITVNYEDDSGKKYENSYNIDLSEIFGLRHVGGPPLKKIADQIEKIVEEIKKLYSSYPQMRVITYSKTEIDKENKEIEEFYENEARKKADQEKDKT
ncbi:MAG: hypothetical protein NTW38_01595 [Candidatus Aminicenantes bacterium]|nr:hypothetical protein [Candidatus Aminicenantes bacterium]